MTGVQTCALPICEAVEMSGFLAAGQRRRGEYLGGDEGRRLVDTADAWLTAQRVRNPAVFVRKREIGSGPKGRTEVL